MADLTGISWADSTFNPWLGCEKVSPGCAHCYAETLVTGTGPRQLNRPGTWGKDGTRQRTSTSTWAKPRAWERQAAQWADEHDGRRRRVFCASLADVFEPRPELIPWRSELFALISATPSLDWLILTKRPGEARDYIDRLYGEAFPEVYPNVWLGTSIENARHTYRAGELRECRVALRFISAEPLLGSLYNDAGPGPNVDDAEGRSPGHATTPSGPGRASLDLTEIAWVIVGGESGGRGARPMHPAWAREIRDAVLASTPIGLACFCSNEAVSQRCPVHGQALARPALHMKQHGSWREARPGERVDFSFPDGLAMHYCGPAPTSAGKYLDGVDWCEVPDSPAAGREAGQLAF